MQAQTPKSRRPSGRAFSIVELLVVIGVVVILLSLAIGPVARSRDSARQAQCMSNLRGAGHLVLADCAQRRDDIPNGGEERRRVLINGVVEFTVGGTAGLNGKSWTALFPDEWAGWVWNPGFRCPKQPRDDVNPLIVPAYVGPWYYMSSALWLDARSLAKGRLAVDVTLKQNNLADVVFPSHKVLLFESLAYCETSKGVNYWIAVGQTPLHPASVLTIDGSVRRAVQANGQPSIDGVMPYYYTLDGVRGRDLK